MKILVVGRGYPREDNSFLGLFEYDQARALKQIGHDVAYVAIDLRSFRRKRPLGITRCIVDGMKIFEISIPIGRVPSFFYVFFYKLAMGIIYRHVKQEWGIPEIVHSHFLDVSAGVVRCFRNRRIPVVMTEHSSLKHRKKSSGRMEMAKNCYNDADCIIAVSNSLKSEICEIINDKNKVRVINNIVNLDNTYSGITKEKRGAFHFVSAGYLHKGKGFDTLLNAFALVVQERPDAALTIYGDGEEKKNLSLLADELGISDAVSFYGRYNKMELPKLFSTADAFVLASRGETFGVVFIEAMACGLPVIGTYCGGPEEFITKDVGLLVEKDNVIELKDAMLDMMFHFESYHSENIEQYAYKHFSSDSIANQIEKVYQFLVESD